MPRSKKLTPRRPPDRAAFGNLPEGLPVELVVAFVEDWVPLGPDDPDVRRMYDYESGTKTPIGALQQIVARGRFVRARWAWCKANAEDPSDTFRKLPPVGYPKWRRRASL